MKIVFLTIVLDGMPFITNHLPIFQRLDLDWEWRIAEGVAAPQRCTSWCKPMAPRLSNDGTTEYLDSIAGGRVKWLALHSWPGKCSMLNAFMDIKEPCIIMQIDSDELWLPHQIELIHEMMTTTGASRMDFHCRYFVGKDIVVTSKNTYGNHDDYEWRRVWAFRPGMTFETHEPPKIRGDDRKVITQAETERMGLTFQHYAYATEAQVVLKEKYYGYTGAVEQWRKLQQNTVWPTRLGDWLPWVKDETIVDKI